jgi:hypothetical protein
MPPTLSLNDNFHVEDEDIIPYLEGESLFYSGFNDLLIEDDFLDRILALDNRSDFVSDSPETGKPCMLLHYDLTEDNGKITWRLKNKPDRLALRARYYLRRQTIAWKKPDKFIELLPEIQDAVKCCIAHRRMILDAISTAKTVKGIHKQLHPDSVTWCSVPED